MSFKTKLTFSSSEDEFFGTSTNYQRKKKTLVQDSDEELILSRNQEIGHNSNAGKQKKISKIFGNEDRCIQNANKIENFVDNQNLMETDKQVLGDETNFDNELSQKFENTSFEESFSYFSSKNK